MTQMTEPAARWTTELDIASAQPRRKKSAEDRIRELLAELKLSRKRIAELERQERERQEARQGNLRDRIAKATEEGRKLFEDFDSVIHGVPVERQAFEAVLASANGPELFYAAGLGMRLIALRRQLQNQAQEDQQRIAYYRQMHQLHFTGEQNGL